MWQAEDPIRWRGENGLGEEDESRLDDVESEIIYEDEDTWEDYL